MESGGATGGDALNGTCGISGISGGIVSSGETTLIGGNAKSGSGRAPAAMRVSMVVIVTKLL